MGLTPSDPVERGARRLARDLALGACLVLVLVGLGQIRATFILIDAAKNMGRAIHHDGRTSPAQKSSEALAVVLSGIPGTLFVLAGVSGFAWMLRERRRANDGKWG